MNFEGEDAEVLGRGLAYAVAWLTEFCGANDPELAKIQRMRERLAVAMFGPQAVSDRYPLWCLDNGDPLDEHRYRGPFETRDHAIVRSHDPDADGDRRWAQAEIRRCRRLRASEICGADWPELVAEDMADQLAEGQFPKECVPWGNWDDSMTTVVNGSMLRSALDSAIRIDCYVCEGDEPEPEVRNCVKETQ